MERPVSKCLGCGNGGNGGWCPLKCFGLQRPVGKDVQKSDDVRFPLSDTQDQSVETSKGYDVGRGVHIVHL